MLQYWSKWAFYSMKSLLHIVVSVHQQFTVHTPCCYNVQKWSGRLVVFSISHVVYSLDALYTVKHVHTCWSNQTGALKIILMPLPLPVKSWHLPTAGSRSCSGLARNGTLVPVFGQSTDYQSLRTAFHNTVLAGDYERITDRAPRPWSLEKHAWTQIHRTSISVLYIFYMIQNQLQL